MRKSLGFRHLLGSVALLAACSSDTTGTNGDAELALVNAATATAGAQLKLDNSPVTLPAVGQSSSMTVTAGSHQLTLTSASGRSLASSSFSIASGARRTAVFTGTNTDSVSLSIAADTMTTNPDGGYHSIVGSILMVHSAQGAGPFDLVFHQVGSDSVYHFGNFAFGAGSQPPPAPYGFYIPFVPATYVVDITNPGSTLPLATAQLTLATDDRWTVMLMYSIEGGLVLQAVKQP